MACKHVWLDSEYKYTTHGSCNIYLKVKTEKSPGGVEENGQARHLPESALQQAQRSNCELEHCSLSLGRGRGSLILFRFALETIALNLSMPIRDANL